MPYFILLPQLTSNIGPRRRNASVASGSSSIEVSKHGVIGVADDHDGALVAGRAGWTVSFNGDDAAVLDPFTEVSLLPQLRVPPPAVDRSCVDPCQRQQNQV